MLEPWCVPGNHSIPRGDDYYVGVRAWARPGRGKNNRSGSSLVLREDIPGETACMVCIARMQQGLAPRQQELFS